jgi:hypothetical protein
MTHTKYSSTKSMLIAGSLVAFGILALANPAAASYGNRHQAKTQTSNSSQIIVSTENNALVMNEVMTVANTGRNDIEGGNTGRGGNGGDATGNNTNAGHGGTSGSSNTEGAIVTGHALAISTVHNDVNNSRAEVTVDCDCVSRTGKNTSEITVWTGNNAAVGNAVGTFAETGDNDIEGGTTGHAGNGGDATSRQTQLMKKYSHKNHSNNSGNANAGSGGNTGSTNNVSAIVTGDAQADTLVTNTVNRSVARVAR